MYIHAIMPHGHISTTHYGIYLQLFFIMIPFDTISMAITLPLLNYYCSTIYDYNTTTYNLIRIHTHQLFIFSLDLFHFE
jgi:hypothetical protein